MLIRLLLIAVLALTPLLAADPSLEIAYKKHVVDLGRNEACTVADVNGDGLLDIVSGSHWFAAPDWTKHQHRDVLYWNNYFDAFSDLALDVDSDGDIDIISVGWSEKKIAWYENPGHKKVAKAGLWTEHPIDSGRSVEFAFLVDLDNDGVRDEVLPQFGNGEGFTAWYEVEGKGADAKWVRHVVSPDRYGHGIGAGDVNGDGRNDVLTPKGWLEAPEDPRQVPWQLHEDYAFDKHVGFLHVLDVDSDGDNDILAPHAHDYGIYWLERTGEGKFERRLVDDAWSQAHALTLADLTGDDFPEIVTGKRFYAHNGHDPGGREPLGLYWYSAYQGTRALEWARHVIHYGGRIGGGMQIPVVDLDSDGDLDIVVAGKGGLYMFENVQ